MLECLLLQRLHLLPKTQCPRALDRQLITINEHANCLFEVVRCAQICEYVSEQMSFVHLGSRMEQSTTPTLSGFQQSKFDMLFALRLQANQSWTWYESVASISDMNFSSNCQRSSNGGLLEEISLMLHVCPNESGSSTALHYRGKERIHFQVSRKAASHAPDTVLVPLSTFFRNDSPCGSPSAKMLSIIQFDRRDRWTLAINIASTVLQACNTPWLRDDWNKCDIFVDRAGFGLSVNGLYLSRDSSSQANLSSYQRELLLSVVQNEVLFTLGLILVEICLGKTLEDMRVSRDPSAAPTFLTYWGIAKAKMGDVYNEDGALYRDVVQRCVFCKFDTPETSFEDEDFRQAAWNGVVVPLKEGLKTLW